MVVSYVREDELSVEPLTSLNQHVLGKLLPYQTIGWFMEGGMVHGRLTLVLQNVQIQAIRPEQYKLECAYVDSGVESERVAAAAGG